PATLAVRTSLNVAALIPTIRRLMQDGGANVDGDVMTGDAYVQKEWRRERLLASTLVLFSVLAVAISCLGIYGTLSYLVISRTPEIGIRMALGARTRAVIRMVLFESLLPVGAGIALGWAAGFILARWVESLLFGVSRNDLVSTIAAAAVL